MKVKGKLQISSQDAEVTHVTCGDTGHTIVIVMVRNLIALDSIRYFLFPRKFLLSGTVWSILNHFCQRATSFMPKWCVNREAFRIWSGATALSCRTILNWSNCKKLLRYNKTLVQLAKAVSLPIWRRSKCRYSYCRPFGQRVFLLIVWKTNLAEKPSFSVRCMRLKNYHSMRFLKNTTLTTTIAIRHRYYLLSWTTFDGGKRVLLKELKVMFKVLPICNVIKPSCGWCYNLFNHLNQQGRWCM